MKIRNIMERLSKLDPDMDMNDLREALTTNRGEVDKLVASLNENIDQWDEFTAALTKDAVIPMLLEIRDLMLMPSSAKGWLKPAEMAKKVAEQVEINEAKCQERIANATKSHEKAMEATKLEHAQKMAEAESFKESQLFDMRQQHDNAVEELDATRKATVADLQEDHKYETERYQERIAEVIQQCKELGENMKDAMKAVPSKQAKAVAEVLTDAADRVEAMAQMRLAKLVKRKNFFRNKDLDQTMLRVEADGIICSAKRLRQMAAEAEEQGVWPIEFADGEEDTLEAKEALSRILAPIRESEKVAQAVMDADIEVEAD